MSSTMVVRQPQPVMVAQSSQEWGSGICDCCDDVPECCFAFWCLPCFTCVTAKKYGECLCLPLLDYLLVGGCIPAITMSMRVSMRQRYGIRGSMCNDCVHSTFCGACVWCQMSREMKKRNIQIVMLRAEVSWGRLTDTELAHHSNAGAIMTSSTMIVTQPQPVMVAQDSEEWGSKICDCCQDVPECCFAFWCFPCFTCMVSKKYGECLCLPLLEMFGGIIRPITMSTRVSMRQRYNIKGTMCNDCVCSTFCTSCVWCQMSREMKRRNIQIVLVGAKYR
ncbi:hypothetical protein Q5P01_019047 [Channa striata]|uniref:Uncharacterized protein n=1 Tax=Channa striata TaxID=64152 RepID=A0AA88SB68_CHASR|nr:hypothetical protein Q5P01_019047 [Channa striata]